MSDTELFDWTVADLLADPSKAKQVFERMLRVLENDGHCRRVFHNLAQVVFNDSLGE